MAKQTVPDLKGLFKQASEIAQQVPEHMQEAAFNRAIDLLTGTTQSDNVLKWITTPKKQKIKSQKKRDEKNQHDSPVDELLTLIDSTQHPGVTSTAKVLDRSLMVLQIAFNDHNIDGLTPSDISRILTEKFRISTTLKAIGMALGRATNLVNRVPRGQGYTYKIMGSGKEYLAHLGKEQETPAQKKRKRVVKSKVTKTPPITDSNKDNGKKNQETKRTKASKKSTKRKSTPRPSVGPKTAITALIDSGFFSKGKTGPEVQAYLKNKRGFNFGTDQIRLAMLRLVRNAMLERDENAEGQYEYTKSST